MNFSDIKVRLVAAVVLVLAAGPGLAEDKKAEDEAAARKALVERHDKLADWHEEMADCLKSDKPVAECREKMKKSCPSVEGGCPACEACGKDGGCKACKGEHAGCKACGEHGGGKACGEHGGQHACAGAGECPHHKKGKAKGKAKSDK